MQLGAFSVSLAVKDLGASRDFYTKLGFEEVGGDASQNWLILRSGLTTIGLFQGMFPNNIMTFNPGWSPTCETLPEFDDVRDIQAALEEHGIEFTSKAEASSMRASSTRIVASERSARAIASEGRASTWTVFPPCSRTTVA